jgi:Flp pilus assembly protein TadG
MTRERGQVLPLFALMLIALFAVAALAIDVSSGYSARQAYRTAADAASLAGAQNLQTLGTRTVTDPDRTRARTDSLASLKQAFNATGTGAGACDPAFQIADCELSGTPFLISIKTPSPTCVLCDPNHSVQVTVRNPTFQLTFARVLGQSQWNVASTSVAGLAFARSYAVVTLRPPKDVGSTWDVNDIILASTNTVVNVFNGDVGSNANMEYSGLNAVLNIDPGYGMYYFDPYFAPKWYTSPPMPPAQIVQQIPTLIPDPNYQYPAMQGSLGTSACVLPLTGSDCAPLFDDARTSEYATIPAVERADEVGSQCEAQLAKVDPTRYTFISSYTRDKIFCFKPGIYQSGSGARDAKITIATGEVGLLLPGAYYLKSGLDVGGLGSRLIGGYDPGQPGVALMFDECANQCTLNANAADTLALNAGTKFPRGTIGVGATAAIDWNNQRVETSGPMSPTPAILMSILVIKDPTCFVPTAAPFQEPAGCDPGAPTNFTVNMAGGGQLDVEGVQYMPTDNVAVSGSSDGKGTVGQLVAWTISYKGDTTLNQEGAGSQGPGTLRLDAACTAPGTPCNP